MDKMATRTRCKACNGSGKVMGGGMMMAECDDCEGAGRIAIVKDDMNELNVRTTESYKKAIEEIRAMSSSITEEQAKKMFDQELEKIEKKENGKNSKNKKE
jgi:septal ring factor EnvC (AmiA/AmiB activator)